MKLDKLGVGSALLASVCCAGPVLLAALGLGSLGLGAFLGAYHWYFLAAGATVLAYAWFSYLRERRRCATRQCEMARGRATGVTLALASLAVAGFLGLNLYTQAGAASQAATAGQAAGQTAGLSQAVLPVEGMTCSICTITVERALQALQGVEQAEASVPGKSVTVRYDPDRVTVDEMVTAVNETGYRARRPGTKG